MLAFIKTGFTTTSGELDDARVNAALMILAYIGMGFYGIYRCDSAQLPSFVQNWAIGAGVLATGIGAWFGIRKDN